MTEEQQTLLTALTEAVETRTRSTEDRDSLIRRGDELNIPKTALAEAANLSRRAVYDILGRPDPEWSVEPPVGTCIEVDYGKTGRVFRREDHHPDFHWRDGRGWYRWSEVRGHARRDNGRIVDSAPWEKLPSQSTDPTPKNRERDTDGVVRAAANIALTEYPGPVGEAINALLWTHYNTEEIRRVIKLARALVAEQADEIARKRGESVANIMAQGAAEMRRQAETAGRLLGETLVRLHEQSGDSSEKL